MIPLVNNACKLIKPNYNNVFVFFERYYLSTGLSKHCVFTRRYKIKTWVNHGKYHSIDRRYLFGESGISRSYYIRTWTNKIAQDLPASTSLETELAIFLTVVK